MTKFLQRLLYAATHDQNVKRAVRGALVTFVTLFVPGLLGWLNDLTSWASGHGSTPFPDAHGLAYLAVSATVAALVGLVNYVVNTLETATGVGFLRSVPPTEVTDIAAKVYREGGTVTETRTVGLSAPVGTKAHETLEAAYPKPDYGAINAERRQRAEGGLDLSLPAPQGEQQHD